jgi:glutaredoxin
MQKVAGEKVTSVPQVVIDGKYIGGYTEVERFLKRL